MSRRYLPIVKKLFDIDKLPSYQVTLDSQVTGLPSYQGSEIMKINCNHDNNGACKTCKHYSHCTLLEPTNKNHTLLTMEINYWMKKLRELNHNLREYEHVFQDINDGAYTTPVNVYGNIQQVPDCNVFGVAIRKPEHVYYGWNYGVMSEQKKELMEHIRLLNRKELNMRKILEKRM